MRPMKYTIIGNASLTFECIKRLHRDSYSISVISDNSLIKNWCHQHSIPTFENISQYKFIDDSTTVLLSIVNYQILKEEFIKRFHFAINYHDSLLPKYAGVYATTWAILNNEHIHGISWHIIDQKIDAGDIVLSRPIKIEAQETSYSLNLKCTNEALLSLPILLNKIENQNLIRKKQHLSKRSFYPKDCTLFAHALISFEDEIESIDKTFRAFNFYKELFNPLSLPKVTINQQSFILIDFETIYKQEKDGFEIAVKGGSLRIKKITNAYGKELTKAEFLERARLETNSCVISYSQLHYQHAKRAENSWHQELINFEYLDDQILTPCHHESYRHEPGNLTATQILQKISASSSLKRYSILYSNEQLFSFSKDHCELYSAFIPITITYGEDRLSPVSTAPILTDLLTRSFFNKTYKTVLIISDNVDLLDKIPFYSFVLIINCIEGLHIFEHNAKLKIFFSEESEGKNVDIPYQRSLGHSAHSLSEYIQTKSKDLKINCILEDDTWYTFDTILKKANQLSHFLIEQGIQNNDMVGIGIPSSANYFISLLAISNIGAAYVPLDPDYPFERLSYIVKDTQLKHILTTQKHSKKFAFSSITTHTFETIQARLNELLETQLSFEESSSLPLYVIYTSGTTGTPKGVVVSHENVINCLTGTLELLNIKHKRFIAVTSTSFDIHLLDYLLPICSSGEVVIAPQEAVRNGKLLCELIEKHHVTAMQATPMTWKMLIESGWVCAKDFLIICCGEPLTYDLALQLSKRGLLYNLYGPTEATIYASGTLIDNPKEITIGTAIGETELLIMDENNQLIHQGEEGQIAISGKGVAIKYLNQPKLTDEKFITHPLKSEERIYLTGDIGKKLANGSIHYCGRKDDQIKINGYRIELKEIEEILKQATSIKNIIVLLQKNNPDAKKITAYVEVSGCPISSSILTTQLKKYAERKLPKFMMPHRYIYVEKFPLMLSGKVDRKILSEIQLDSSSETPNLSDIEKKILVIWEKLLNITTLQIQDDFFSLGGNSLLAIRLANQLALVFEIDLEYANIIELTTIQQQAEFIESSLSTPTI